MDYLLPPGWPVPMIPEWGRQINNVVLVLPGAFFVHPHCAISEQIEAANLEVARGRKLLLKEEIDAQDFREIKRENEKKIERLEARLMEVSSLSANIEPLLEKAVSNLAHLDELYQDGDTKRKRTIIGSIYPEKLTFDGFQYRTTRVNEAVELIYTLDAGFSQKETGQTKEDFDLSCLVTPSGLAALILSALALLKASHPAIAGWDYFICPLWRTRSPRYQIK